MFCSNNLIVFNCLISITIHVYYCIKLNICSVDADVYFTKQYNLYWPVGYHPSTTGVTYYIRFLIFYQHIQYHLLNMLKIKCDINQQYLKTVHLHFVKYE